jgi:hypothetical protein
VGLILEVEVVHTGNTHPRRKTMARSTSAAAKPRTRKPKLQTADLIEQLKEDVSEASTAVESEQREEPKQRRAREVGPATQAVIDRIRELYEDEGLGFPSVAKKLNDEKVKTFRGGETWHPPVVRGICLRNGFVKGEKRKASAEA